MLIRSWWQKRRSVGKKAQTVAQELFPLASIITPNIPDVEVLCGVPWTDRAR